MPVFGGLNASTLELVTSLAVTTGCAEGEHFFREGDDSHAMYVLLRGRVEIYKSWQSAQKHLRYMNPGDCFGEMALIDFGPRSASARASERSEALEIAPTLLQAVYGHDLEQFTLLQMNMAREISRRLRRVDELLFRAMMGGDMPETALGDLS